MSEKNFLKKIGRKKMRRVVNSNMSSGELSQIRGGLGLTQSKMAEKLGMSLRMYRYYEVENAPIPVVVEIASKNLDGSGTLTSYDMERMKKLREEIDNTLSVGSVDVAHIEKILLQSSKELQNVLSKS